MYGSGGGALTHNSVSKSLGKVAWYTHCAVGTILLNQTAVGSVVGSSLTVPICVLGTPGESIKSDLHKDPGRTIS